MSVRDIPGLLYAEKPGYSKGDCAICGYPGCRCEARPTPKHRERYKAGATICGSCREDGSIPAIREAVASSRTAARPERRTEPWIAGVLVAGAVACILAQLFCPQSAAGRTPSAIPWERPSWSGGEVRGDGRDTRAEVLAKRCVALAWTRTGRAVAIAQCRDAYSGEPATRPGKGWEIDHELAASVAWRSRVWADDNGQPCDRWIPKAAAHCAEFVRFFNDVDNLSVTTATENHRKSDLGPGSWCPALRGSRMALAKRMRRTAERWALTFSREDERGLDAWARGECAVRR